MTHATATHARPWYRRAAALALVATAALTLTGCIKMDMALDVQSDDTVDGTIVFAVDKSFITAFGQDPQEFVKDMATQAPVSPEAGQGSVTATPYDKDGKIGTSWTFKDVPIAKLGSDDGSLKLVREGDLFRFTGTMSAKDQAAATGDASFDPSLLQGFDVKVAVTFPGDVVSSNGTVTGRTVTWTPKADENLTMEAVAKATAPSASPLSSPATWIVVGLLLAFVVAAGVLLLTRRGKRAPGAEAPALESIDQTPVAAAPPAGPAYPVAPPTTAPTTPPAPPAPPVPPAE